MSAQPGSTTGGTTPFATVNVSPFLWYVTMRAVVCGVARGWCHACGVRDAAAAKDDDDEDDDASARRRRSPSRDATRDRATAPVGDADVQG